MKFSLVADRYQYLAGIGLLAVVAEALDHLGLAVESPATADTRGALYLYMGQSAGELGRLEEAEAHLERAVAAMPDNVLTLLAMGELRVRQDVRRKRKRSGAGRGKCTPTIRHCGT